MNENVPVHLNAEWHGSVMVTRGVMHAKFVSGGEATVRRGSVTPTRADVRLKDDSLAFESLQNLACLIHLDTLFQLDDRRWLLSR